MMNSDITGAERVKQMGALFERCCKALGRKHEESPRAGAFMIL